ncbi:hut operon transcriptional regulator HutP [Mesobacillus subterraneus]|uniref:Hut operon positive regulatory protein n=1 Tax=Mesobacillus subterraneus TaxID=285983 RepID=A0A427TP08_9BACI|nr:hut operon transcriptional regulator HutP [Mesobacillus subterraneus]RSD26110.1 anti-terminator HutP [Mesobacillus subterraneus]
MNRSISIGKTAILLTTLSEQELKLLSPTLDNVKFCIGQVGSMNMQKVISAVETAARRNELIHSGLYRETHALYHAIMEGMEGVTRGHLAIGDMSRTVGLRFAVVRGKPFTNEGEGEWIAVAFYGTIGAPIKGSEHETVGLGINHI